MEVSPTSAHHTDKPGLCCSSGSDPQTPSQLLVTSTRRAAPSPLPFRVGEHCFQKGCCSINLVQYCHLVFCAFPAPHTRVLTVHTCNRHTDMHTSRLLLNRQAGSQHWGPLGVSVFAFLVLLPENWNRLAPAVLLSSLWDLYPQILAGRRAGLPDTTRAPVPCGFKISNEGGFSASPSGACQEAFTVDQKFSHNSASCGFRA